LSVDLNLEHNPAIAAEIPVNFQDWQQWFAIWTEQIISDDSDNGSDNFSDNDFGLNGESDHTTNYELTLRLTDDIEIQTLNAQYRQQDRPTDVLAFASLEADVPSIPQNLLPQALISEMLPDMWSEPTYLGDIVISVPTAAEQALSRGHSQRWELAWLAAHGLLHLLGWDHPDEESLEKMLAKQEVLLRSVNL
jgi:probable rRNA maturation factor